MSRLYILDSASTPRVMECQTSWRAWMSKHSQILSEVATPDLVISTIFTGEAPNERGAPRVFENRVISPDGHIERIGQYASRRMAQAYQHLAVKSLRERVANAAASLAEALRQCSDALVRAALLEILSLEGYSHRNAELLAECEINGFTNARVTDESGVIAIASAGFTTSIISGVEISSYDDRWCYRNYEQAKAAFDSWDGVGEPHGWAKHPRTRRRTDSLIE